MRTLHVGRVGRNLAFDDVLRLRRNHQVVRLAADELGWSAAPRAGSFVLHVPVLVDGNRTAGGEAEQGVHPYRYGDRGWLALGVVPHDVVPELPGDRQVVPVHDHGPVGAHVDDARVRVTRDHTCRSADVLSSVEFVPVGGGHLVEIDVVAGGDHFLARPALDIDGRNAVVVAVDDDRVHRVRLRLAVECDRELVDSRDDVAHERLALVPLDVVEHDGRALAFQRAGEDGPDFMLQINRRRHVYQQPLLFEEFHVLAQVLVADLSVPCCHPHSLSDRVRPGSSGRFQRGDGTLDYEKRQA